MNKKNGQPSRGGRFLWQVGLIIGSYLGATTSPKDVIRDPVRMPSCVLDILRPTSRNCQEHHYDIQGYCDEREASRQTIHSA